MSEPKIQETNLRHTLYEALKCALKRMEEDCKTSEDHDDTPWEIQEVRSALNAAETLHPELTHSRLTKKSIASH